MYNLQHLNSRIGRKKNLHEYKDSLVIYSLTNKITNKVYVGLTKNIKRRIVDFNRAFLNKNVVNEINNVIKKHLI